MFVDGQNIWAPWTCLGTVDMFGHGEHVVAP